MQKKYLKFILFVAFCLPSIYNYSQETVKLYKDKVYLKNGSLIRGEIIDYNPGEMLILEMQNGNTLSLQDTQIRKITMISASDRKDEMPLKSMRFYNETQFSFLTGVSGTGLSLAHNVFYQPKWWAGLGAGAGIDNYYLAPGRDIYTFFANAKFTITKGNNAPYVGAKIGYGAAFKNPEENFVSASGGLLTNPYFGIRIGSRGLIFNIFSGLKFQKAEYEIVNSFETRMETIFFKRSEIGVSVMF